jgi:hypothetical protein
MNSNSKSVHPPDTYSQPLADIMGTAIALVTLILPISVISHYSSPNIQHDQQSLMDNSGNIPKQANPNPQIDKT